MNEIKRYDQALTDQLEHLPMPPEDMAWAAMNKLLEEDDDDPVIIPFFRRPGCLLSALLAALALLIAGYWYFNRQPINHAAGQEQGTNREQVPGNMPPIKNAEITKELPGQDSIPSSGAAATGPDTAGGSVHQSGQHTIALSRLNNNSSLELKNAGKGRYATQQKKKLTTSGKYAVRILPPEDAVTNDGDALKNRRRRTKSSASKTDTRIRPGIAGTDMGDSAGKINTAKQQVEGKDQLKISVEPAAVDSPGNQLVQKDSSIPVKTDSVQSGKTKPAEAQKQKEKREKSWMLAAGLSVYQPFAIDGEPAVPYNRYGRKGSVTDYIPAAYFRLYRTKTWFAHLEFRYGAPQAVKPFNYKEEIRDSLQAVFRTTYQLRKTYYHQLPLSFHYYVLPNLSLGAGVIYNHFSGAIAQQQVFRSLGGAVDTLVSEGTVRDREAGKLIKNHFQWSAEMQYQWRRISLGGRYSSDINPYIKYPDSNTGASIEKKAKAFNIFLRYDLWRSKKW